VANRIEWVAGIVNGTSNFILTQMREQGLDFASALQQAQKLGYAEADPRFDVDGIDAAHKLCLLAANAFGSPVDFAQVPAVGIGAITAVDMAYAQQLGYCTKLLAFASRHAHGMELRVQPVLLPADHLLAGVNGSMNAVLVKGDASGVTLYYGAGAGSEETASAVVADLVDVARTGANAAALRVPHLAFQPHALQTLAQCPAAHSRAVWYLRVHSQAGAPTERALLRALAKAGVQARLHGCYTQSDRSVHHVLLTQPLLPVQQQQALQRLAQLPGLLSPVQGLPVQRLD
jgi:homoserine dehydrogenase